MKQFERRLRDLEQIDSGFDGDVEAARRYVDECVQAKDWPDDNRFIAALCVALTPEELRELARLLDQDSRA